MSKKAKYDPEAIAAEALSSGGPSPALIDNCSLIAEILSYNITNTVDFAKLRLVSKGWNNNVLPYILHSSGFIEICYPPHDGFITALLKMRELTREGQLYIFDQAEGEIDDGDSIHEDEGSNGSGEESDEGSNGSAEESEPENNEEASIPATTSMFERGGKTVALLIISEIGKTTHPKLTLRDDGRFQSRATILTETKSFEEFKKMGKESIGLGMYLPVGQTTYEPVEDNWNPLFAVIVTETLSKDGGEIMEEPLGKTLSFKIHESGLFSGIEGGEEGGTYKGFVTREDDNTITCLIPMILAIDEDSMHDDSSAFEDDLLPISSLWRRFQEKCLVPEGIALADGVIPDSLHNALMLEIDSFAAKTPVDYHPHSNDVVRDHVHPALYAYVKDVSPLVEVKPEPSALFLEHMKDTRREEEASAEGKDYWGRQFEASAKYQWLPTYFDVNNDGSCSIADYINNLVPRSEHTGLYNSLAQLFSHAIPLLESVYSYGNYVRPLIRDEPDDIDYQDSPIQPIKIEPCSLRGQRLQVITKIVDYELAQGDSESYEGVWHVEGMSHEDIVATAIYFIHRDADIKGGDILFKRAFHRDEAHFIFSNIGQVRPSTLESIINEGLQPLGKVQTLPKRLLVFPNSHVHKVTKMQNESQDTNNTREVQKRRIIVFFLVNPEKRIISTREVSPQQIEAGGSMTREQAMEHRLELMKERKYTKQDWNVRDIELCEH